MSIPENPEIQNSEISGEKFYCHSCRNTLGEQFKNCPHCNSLLVFPLPENGVMPEFPILENEEDLVNTAEYQGIKGFLLLIVILLLVFLPFGYISLFFTTLSEIAGPITLTSAGMFVIIYLIVGLLFPAGASFLAGLFLLQKRMNAVSFAKNTMAFLIGVELFTFVY